MLDAVKMERLEPQRQYTEIYAPWARRRGGISLERFSSALRRRGIGEAEEGERGERASWWMAEGSPCLIRAKANDDYILSLIPHLWQW